MSAYTQDVNLDPQTEAELGRAAIQLIRRLAKAIDASAVAKAFVRSHADAFDAYRRGQIVVARMHALDVKAGRVKTDLMGWCEECGQVHEIEVRRASARELEQDRNGGAT